MEIDYEQLILFGERPEFTPKQIDNILVQSQERKEHQHRMAEGYCLLMECLRGEHDNV